ncbi:MULTISPECIES: hypothetical protein [unclassified Olleya]|jgi:hypothetical protein|nr:hypothetical protein [Olleya sp. Hel_I_94]TVZ46210.1 hypothetical protein JM82_0778 [Olleya sp. Hel_I_94]|tara:strand:- start:114 stop:263 length:150 start_codon:yes stop_codon:yes gene_type:complete
MISQNIALYSWSNGVVMIAIFAVICLLLIGFLVKSMSSSDRKDDEAKER